MTKEEFEALLLKKGFRKPEAYKHYYFYEIGDGDLFISVETLRNGLDLMVESENSDPIRLYADVTFLTEQKLDEILSQCNKIKTSLEMINQIAKEE